MVPEDHKLALLEAASDLEEAIDGPKGQQAGRHTFAEEVLIGQLEQNAANPYGIGRRGQ